ncbi:unnamed protein product [Mytilus edulis]|uniref:Uncharacterized protein n=1 Tax=Mytilus edulis TaxID=6550 RepID=A0A8S3SWC0_MYTED|nr:unnamed protein product [Mytilus edulis]
MPLPAYIYRVLRDDENTAEGLKARNPEANITPSSHIAGKRVSQYISTTANLEAATRFLGLAKDRSKKKRIIQKTSRIVKINVKRLKNVKIIDLSDPAVLDEHIPKDPKRPKYNSMFRNWATRYEEVLIEGPIPPECIETIEDEVASDNYDPSDYSENEDSVSSLSDDMSALSVKK